MLLAVVQSVELPANREGDHPMAEAAASASENLVLCIRPSAPIVEKKPWFPFNHARIDRCIVAIVINHARASVIPVARAGEYMCQIIVNPNVPFDVALKQFSRKVQDAGILREVRRRRHFEPSQAQRKRKAAAQLRKRKRARF